MSQVVRALRAHLGTFEVDDKIREKFFDRGDFSHGVVMTIVPAVPMILLCPKCDEKHVDRGVFGTTHVHRTHLCDEVRSHLETVQLRDGGCGGRGGVQDGGVGRDDRRWQHEPHRSGRPPLDIDRADDRLLLDRP